MVGLNRLTCHINQLVQLRGQERPVLNLTSKPQSLAKRQLNNKDEHSTARSEYRSYSLWQTHEIVSFIQPNSEATASQKYGVSQSGPSGKAFTCILETCELFTMCDGAYIELLTI